MDKDCKIEWLPREHSLNSSNSPFSGDGASGGASGLIAAKLWAFVGVGLYLV